MYRLKIRLLVLLPVLLNGGLALLASSNLFAQSAQPTITIIDSATKTQLKQMVLLDARDLKTCQTSSVAGSRCLPASNFHSKEGELASFYDIGWAFGTANLKESDNILVFADDPQDRNFLAGLLFLAGQHKIAYWSGKTAKLQAILGKATGKPRGILRSHIYSGLMRDGYIVLPNDPVSSSRLLVIAKESPVTSIAAFAQTLAEGNEKARVIIDKATKRKTKPQKSKP